MELKILTLKRGCKDKSSSINIWNERNNKMRIPSIIISKGIKYDTVNYDIDPLGNDYNISQENKEKIEENIFNIYKKNIGKQKKIDGVFGFSGYFKIPSENSQEIAEEIFDLLIKYII